MVNDGYKFVLPPLVLGLLAAAFRLRVAGIVFFLVAAFVMYFFRDPNRVAPTDPAVVVSPADGRVVVVVDEPLNGRPGKRISIFLAIWNVHVNRSPMRGRIEQVSYVPGRFHAAM